MRSRKPNSDARLDEVEMDRPTASPELVVGNELEVDAWHVEHIALSAILGRLRDCRAAPTTCFAIVIDGIDEQYRMDTTAHMPNLVARNLDSVSCPCA